LNVWEKWGDPFSAQYKIWDREYWNNFWDKCRYTQKEIYLALRNIHFAVKNGNYERRFISPDPCKFIQGGMIDRGLSEEFKDWWDWDHPEQYVDPNLKNMRDD